MGTTNLDTLALGGDLTVTGTLTAGGIVGTVSENSASVGTADDGTSQTLTAGMVTGSPVFVSHTSTGGTTPSLTMPLATAIIAAYTGWVIGNSYHLRIINNNSGIATIVTNTGITTSGTLTIAPGGAADFVIRMSAAATVTMTNISSAGAVTLAGTQTLTNKTLTSPTLTAPVLGVATATSLNGLTVTTSTGTLTIPNSVVLTGPAASGTAATLAGSETLTNKTLTSPTINLATLTLAAAQVGTFTANGATPVTVSNAAVTANSNIIITLKTVGGTVGAYPAIKTITASTGFTVAATASDTSVYNYAIIG